MLSLEPTLLQTRRLHPHSLQPVGKPVGGWNARAEQHKFTRPKQQDVLAAAWHAGLRGDKLKPLAENE